MQSKQAHHKNGTTDIEQGVRKQSTSMSTVLCNPDDRRVKAPSKTRTCGSKANLLPSKLDKVPCRPLPPLQGTVLMVERNDSRMSFKPAKSSDHGSHPTVPVKGQHVFPVPTHNSSVSVTKVQTAADHETLCMESKHTPSVDLAKKASKNNTVPTQLQRSRSANRLSGSSSGSSSARSSKLSHFPYESSDTRQSRPVTPCNIGQHAAVEKSAHTTTVGQVSNEVYSASNKSNRTNGQISRRRSSSVSSTARVSLQEIKQMLTSSPLSWRKHNRMSETEVSRASEGKQRHNFTVENSSVAPDMDGKARSKSDTKQSPSDDQCMQSVEKHAAVCSTSLEQYGTDEHLHKQKSLEKSSSNHGILGGKSDDEVSEPVKSFVSVDWKSSSCESRQNSVVRADYFFLVNYSSLSSRYDVIQLLNVKRMLRIVQSNLAKRPHRHLIFPQKYPFLQGIWTSI